jgi:uncharacterized membrane protein (UPF0127 family)
MSKLTAMLRNIHPEDRMPYAWMVFFYTLLLLSFLTMGGCTYTIKEGGPSRPSTPTQQKAG